MSSPQQPLSIMVYVDVMNVTTLSKCADVGGLQLSDSLWKWNLLAPEAWSFWAHPGTVPDSSERRDSATQCCSGNQGIKVSQACNIERVKGRNLVQASCAAGQISKDPKVRPLSGLWSRLSWLHFPTPMRSMQAPQAPSPPPCAGSPLVPLSAWALACPLSSGLALWRPSFLPFPNPMSLASCEILHYLRCLYGSIFSLTVSASSFLAHMPEAGKAQTPEHSKDCPMEA